MSAKRSSLGRRPRRLLHHAAQAQSGRGRDARSPPPPWRRIWRRRFSPRRCRITSAAPGHGTRNGRRCRALLLVTSGALAAIVDIAEGLEVDAARMRANLDATGGLIMAEAVTMALAEKIGKSEAHHLVEAASKKAVAEKKHLRDVLTADPKVTAHLERRQTCKTVRADGLSGRLASPDRPPARFARRTQRKTTRRRFRCR